MMFCDVLSLSVTIIMLELNTIVHMNMRINLTFQEILNPYCQARVLVLVILLDYSLRLVSIPVSKGPELKL